MKNRFFLFIICFVSLSYSDQNLNNTPENKPNTSSAVTWIPNGGRFGDNLVSYARAKWLSYKHDIPVLHFPFQYSNQLMLHEQENVYKPECEELFSGVMLLPLSSNYTIKKESNTLYFSRWKTDIAIDWSDTIFIKELKKQIAPCKKLNLISIPNNCISIAIHVRNGGSFTPDNAKQQWPLRFVPNKFFIDQAQLLTQIFDHENIYIHIFTDDDQPAQLVKKFKKKLNNPRITFGYRENNNHHYTNVLEDMFSMMEFDCLVRPESHFSLFVQRLGKNKVAIYPESVRKTSDGKTKVAVTIMQTRATEHEPWKTEKIITT